MLAAGKGNAHAQVVKVLLKAGANPNVCQNLNCYTALMVAAETYETGIITGADGSDADVNAKNNFGETALTVQASGSPEWTIDNNASRNCGN